MRGVNQALLLEYYFFILSEIDALRKVKGKKIQYELEWVDAWRQTERESVRVSEQMVGKREYCKVIQDVLLELLRFVLL